MYLPSISTLLKSVNIVSCLAVFLILAAGPTAASDADFTEETELLASVPEDSRALGESVTARPKLGKVGFVYQDDQGQRVCLNDECSPHVDRVAKGMPVVSENGEHWAAVVQKDEKARVMLNGQLSGSYDMVFDLTFSPDSMHLAYLAQKDDEFFVYRNQNRHQSFALINPELGLKFSPDSEHLVYAATQDEETWQLVLDGEPGPEFEQIKHVTFSPDSSSLAYAAKQDGKWHLIQDGDKGPGYQDIMRVAFGPESERLAYIARKEEGSVMVLDGEEMQEFEHIPGEPMFSRDGQRLAYVVAEKSGNKALMRMVLDTEVGPAYDQIGAYQFSPDGEDFAYMAEKDGKGRIVHNGEEHKAHDSVGIPVFSSQGSLAYMLLDKEEWRVWADGETGPGFDRVRNPVFSPDGERMAYLARDGQDYAVVEDHEVIDTYSWAGNLGFGPQGHMVYAAAREGESFLVVDGEQGEERFLSFLKETPLVFVEDKVIQGLALRDKGREFHLLRVEIE